MRLLKYKKPKRFYCKSLSITRFRFPGRDRFFPHFIFTFTSEFLLSFLIEILAQILLSDENTLLWYTI